MAKNTAIEEYDFDRIYTQYKLMKENEKIIDFLDVGEANVRRIVYEEIIKQPDNLFEIFSSFLNFPMDFRWKKLTTEYQKKGTMKKINFLERFREDLLHFENIKSMPLT